MKFERVINGIYRYLEREMFPKLTSWQAVAMGVVAGRLVKRADAVKITLQTHPIAKLLGIVDENGNVDITELYNDIKTEAQKRQGIAFEDVPLIGNIKFAVEDIDKMYRIITAGEEA